MGYTKEIGFGHLVDRLYIHWDITTMCEYKCSYCYAREEYKDKWMRPGPWKKQQYVIDELAKSTLPVFLGLLGGEPTSHHKYFEMIKQIEDKVIQHKDSRLYITTNGAKSNDFFNKHTYNNKMRFLWSFHIEYMTEETIQNFISNIEIISKKGFKSRVNIMLHPAKKYWFIIKKLILDLDDMSRIYNIEIHPHFIYSTPHNSIKYSDDFYKEFHFVDKLLKKEYRFFNGKNYEDFSDIEVFEKKMNKFKGWNCYNNNYEIGLNCDINQFCFGDKKPIEIDFFKNITKVKPVKCPHEFCSCDGLLKIKKEKYK